MLWQAGAGLDDACRPDLSEPLRNVLPYNPTRRAHAHVRLDAHKHLEIPEFHDALAWGESHLAAIRGAHTAKPQLVKVFLANRKHLALVMLRPIA